MSVGVGNGGIWENHLCTGDVQGAGVIGARERLTVAGERPGRTGGRSQGVGGDPRAAFENLPATPVPS